MTKQQFIELGLTEDLAGKAATASVKELEGYVPMHRFEEVNTENKNLKTTVKDNETALEELKKTAGNSEALTQTIQKLQDDTKEKEQQHKAEIAEIKMNNAIKLAITGKAQDEELVSGLFDKSKLILGDDGKITGLDEQLKTLKESKAFLFKEEQTEQKPGFHKVGGNPPEGGSGEHSVSLKDAIAAKLNV